MILRNNSYFRLSVRNAERFFLVPENPLENLLKKSLAFSTRVCYYL